MNSAQHTTVGQRFERLLRDDNQQAQRLLAAPDWLAEESVHQFRLCLKRLRAGWRMAQGVDAHSRKAAQRVLKTAAQALSGQRDADVRQTTWRRVRAAAQALPAAQLATLDALVEPPLHPVPLAVERAALQALLAREAALRADAQLTACRWSQLQQGRKHTAAKNRYWAEQALGGIDNETYHRWRRWAKHLLYQRQLAAALRGRPPGQRQLLLKQLGSELGRKHDLDLLAAYLQQRAENPPQRQALQAIQPVIAALNDEQQTNIAELYRRFDRRRARATTP